MSDSSEGGVGVPQGNRSERPSNRGTGILGPIVGNRSTSESCSSLRRNALQSADSLSSAVHELPLIAVGKSVHMQSRRSGLLTAMDRTGTGGRGRGRGLDMIGRGSRGRGREVPGRRGER
jgi:hypothetical protein